MLDGALIIVCNLRLLITLRHCNCPSLMLPQPDVSECLRLEQTFQEINPWRQEH